MDVATTNNFRRPLYRSTTPRESERGHDGLQEEEICKGVRLDKFSTKYTPIEKVSVRLSTYILAEATVWWPAYTSRSRVFRCLPHHCMCLRIGACTV